MLLSKSDLRRFHGLTILGLLLVSVFVGTLIIHPIYGGNGDWWNYSWRYRKSITIDHSKVADDLTDFPVLIDISDTDLASKALANGDDIAFADYSGNKLDHEIELYSSGQLVVWVRVPNLSSTSNTILYMYYGNPSASNQENPTGVWDSNYVMVQHLEETSGTHYDSTVNGNDGTAQGGLNQNAAGKIDGADDFDGGDDYVNVGSKASINDINQITITAWIKLDVAGVSHWIFDKGWTSGKSFYVHSADMLCFVQGFTSGSPNPYGWWKSPTNVVTAGSWYHVAVTYDASSSGNDPIFYVNGILVSTTEGNTPSGTALSDATYNGLIGGTVEYMDGVIDEFRVSELMRSADWISTEYTNQLSPGTFYNVGSEEERVIPEEPWLNDEYPQDEATDVMLNPTLSINATDFQGDSMTIIFRTNATGPWQTIGTKTGYNGTYTQTTTEMDSYSTKYYWRVCASDATHWTNKTYTFTTVSAPPLWWNYFWQYRKKITIDHTNVAADLTDFPVLIDITDSDLASKAQASGDDIAFTGYYGNKLDHEIELYSSGRLIAWVRVPNLSSIEDTILYMYYGNGTCSSQENHSGVWDSHYKMVQHFSPIGAVPDCIVSCLTSGYFSGGHDVVVGPNENYAYFMSWSGYLSVINITDPENPSIVASTNTGIGADGKNGYNVVVSWDMAYIAAYGGGVGRIVSYNISDPTSPLYKGHLQSSNYNSAHGIKVDPDDLNVVYMACYATDSVVSFNVSDPTNIIELDLLTDSTYLGKIHDINVKGDYLYTTSGGAAASVDRFTVVDISDPKNMSIVSSVQDSNALHDTRGVDLVGDYAYVAVCNQDRDRGGITIVNVADPTNPFVEGYIHESAYQYAHDIHKIPGKDEVVTCHFYDLDSVTVFNVSDPSNPSVARTTGKRSELHLPHDGDLIGDKYSLWACDGALTIVDNEKIAPKVFADYEDSTVNDNDGTPHNGAADTDGKINGACVFDGVDDYVDVGSKASIDNINQITITAWIKPNSWGENNAGYIFDKGFTSGKALYIYNNPEGLHFVHGFSTHYGWWHGGGFVFDGSWYFVAVTFDNTNTANDPMIYINGVPVSIVEGDAPVGTAVSDAGFNGYIGSNLDGSRNFDGTIDELRISNPIRTADWILTEYNNQLSPGTFYTVGSEEERVIPEEPWLNDEYPSDGATDVELNPTLSIHAVDFQGDSMTILFRTNASGSWQTIGTKTGYNGTYTQTTTNMNGYSIRYCWRACASDGTHWTNETYTFTTRPENYAPSVSSPSPQGGATGVGFDPLLSVDVNDLDGDPMTIIFSTNTTGSWQVIGTKTGGNGRYNQTTTGMDESSKTYHWKVNVTDGKTWTNETYSFTTWTTEDLYKQIGYYWCAGLPYAGESKDKDTFYIIWFAKENMYPWPPYGDLALWYAEFNRKTGWVDGTVLYSSWLCNWGAVSQYTGCMHFGYFGDEYHVFWSGGRHLSHLGGASEWSDFQSMTGGWTYLSDDLGPLADPWGSVYAFNNSYAITFFTKQYAAPQGNTIVYWIWDETSGWSSPAGIPIWSTSTGVTGSGYPHDCSGAVLLPINKTTWYLYYKSDVGGDHFNIVKTFDAGQTWGTPQIASIPDQPHWRTHRPAFVRYGDNFYMIVNVGGNDISCYYSTDGEHWGNQQVMHSGNWYVPHGVMLDQSHILWTDSEIGWYPGSGRTGDEFGGVFEVSEMIANPGKPSDPYPSNGASLSEGTTDTSLRVAVHGDQTYDVAFYWANGTFIGEDKLLREGDVASVEVSGLKDGETYEWYATARGTTYGYWGNEPDATSDENKSDTFSFTLGAEPKLKMNPSNVTRHKHCEQFTVQINLTDAVNVEDFAFEIHYNTTLIDYVAINWGTFLNGAKVIDTIDEASGVIQGHIETSTTVTGSGWLLNITFHADKTIIWKDCPGWLDKLEGAIWFHWAELSYPGGIYLRYEEWSGGRREITVNQVVYMFSPIQGDVDNDGDVDIMDLRTVAAFYNVEEEDTTWDLAEAYDLNCDDIIDIFDLVIIAVKFGTAYDC